MASKLESLYPYVPVWAQNLGISLFGLAWKRERLGGRFEEHARGYKERESWPKSRFDEYCTSRLRETLLAAFDGCPFYRERWGAIGIQRADLMSMQIDQLGRLPTVRKLDFRQRCNEFIQERYAAREIRRYYSSGTTGTPVTAVCTVDGHRQFIAAREARSFGWAGVSVRHPRSMIGGRMVIPPGQLEPPFHRYNWAERQVYFSSFHISPKNATHYVAALNHYRPRVFTGYAYSHFALAGMMLGQGLSLKYQPEALILGSEKLTREMRVTISKAFGARVYEEYGCVENCVLATECEQGRLHISPDFGIVEIVDDNGCPVSAGVEGRILCTSLNNEAQPLIRYEIGDLASWSGEKCPCGRDSMPVIQEIVGRIEDAVIGPDGRKLVRFHGLFVGLPSVVEGQVIQETTRNFTVKVVPGNGYGLEQENQIRDRLLQRVGQVNVTVEEVDSIPRTERGKFRAVISHVKASDS